MPDDLSDSVLPAIGSFPVHPPIDIVEIWRQIEMAEEVLQEILLVDRQSLMSDEEFGQRLSHPVRSYRSATAWRLLPPPVGSWVRERYGR